MSPKATAAAAGGLAVTVAAIALWPWLPPGTPAAGPGLIALAWAGFAVGVWCLRATPTRGAVALVLTGAVAVQLAAGLGPPRSSDDLYRYLWDGRVQSAGVDPYRFAPAAPELTHLRDPYLWPPQRATWCVPAGAVDQETGGPLEPGCTLINRPTVHTIYPPVAQWLFRAVAAVPGPGPPYRSMQLVASLMAIATTLLLVVGLRRRGDDPRRAALWAWCPLVAIEAGSNGHIDVAAAGLTAAALLVLAGRSAQRSARVAAVGGALLGLAVATKLTPALVLPAVVRRRPLPVIGSTLGVVGLSYLPHVVTVGTAVIGYLPGYLDEEGYGNGTRFALLTWLVPDSWAPWLALSILAVVATAAARRTDPDRPWHSGAIVVGSAIILTSPAYPWYAVLLVVLVALGARVQWLVVAAAGYVAQYAHELGLSGGTARQIGYGTAVLVLLAAWVVRRRRARIGTPGP